MRKKNTGDRRKNKCKTLKGERGRCTGRTVSSSQSIDEMQGTFGGKVNTSKRELIQ